MSALTDAEKLAQPMGQFELWCEKLFVYWDARLGFRYVKGLPK